MKIFIGADHRGRMLKQIIMQQMATSAWQDVGTHTDERTDYPIYAKLVCEAVLKDSSYKGILICGSGVGICMAANRYKGIYAALCWDTAVAKVAVEDDKANVLVLPSDFVTTDKAIMIVDAWLKATFKGGRYQSRLAMIDE